MSTKESRESGGKEVLFGGRDLREKVKGGSGSRGGDRERVKGRRRGRDVCEVRMGMCCRVTRELVVNLANMGTMGVSVKVLVELLF